MYDAQRFAIENIYCSPTQDRQLSFGLIRITKPLIPVIGSVSIHGSAKSLPNSVDKFHVFIVGSVNGTAMNLFRKTPEWAVSPWVNVEDDINTRNYIFQLYNDKGMMVPRKFIYYSFVNNNCLILAVKITQDIRRVFDFSSKYSMRLYSAHYFNEREFLTETRVGVYCKTFYVNNNADKVVIQNKIAELKNNGGDYFLYVDGFYVRTMSLNIPNGSLVELLYDQSVEIVEENLIADLRTFSSKLDDIPKYLLHRKDSSGYIQYKDDTELYITTNNELVERGLFYYQHKDTAVRNVTDKDFSLNVLFVNNQASLISSMFTGSIQDKKIVSYIRRSNVDRPLIYSSLKLHELYKLPDNIELDVLASSSYSIEQFRAEHLENSDYFKLSSVKNLRYATRELTTSAIGYNGLSYYFAQSPVIKDEVEGIVRIPRLYQEGSIAYNYDRNGLLVSIEKAKGPIHIPDVDVYSSEFFLGSTPPYYERLFTGNETITIRDAEFRLISAYYEGTTRVTDWVDITETLDVIDGKVTLNESSGRKVKIVYFDQPYSYDVEISFNNGTLLFQLPIWEDRGFGIGIYPLDVPYRNISVFLNKYKLAQGIDYEIEFPYISIFNKTYLDYSSDKQRIHIRATGFTTNIADINKDDIVGFVNNGALCRNGYYDIRDDRVFSVTIDGKLYDRDKVIYAEDDNVVRISDPLNGKPYTISEPFIPTKSLTGDDSVTCYLKNKANDKSISDLFNIVYGEPKINTFESINGFHYLFSPLISKIINDLKTGTIPQAFYTQPYDDAMIHNLIASNYSLISRLDPINNTFPNNLVVIHPHIGNATVELDLYQYRFINNLVKLLTKASTNEVIVSGYLTVTSNFVKDETSVLIPSPIIPVIDPNPGKNDEPVIVPTPIILTPFPAPVVDYNPNDTIALSGEFFKNYLSSKTEDNYQHVAYSHYNLDISDEVRTWMMLRNY